MAYGYLHSFQDMAYGYLAVQMIPIRQDGVVGEPIFYPIMEQIELSDPPKNLPKCKIIKNGKEIPLQIDQGTFLEIQTGQVFSFSSPVTLGVIPNGKILMMLIITHHI